ncbi:hypothetical protein DCS_00069 [Drechmeria coniospora]|uniref:chitinase n=1 Tax=Drechmeria coniospora TaxID=98403 RepID=A0A151GPL5_DRECN|nr:hypothetical protein DCS_00069 [Drechmeria coniospora]KYK58942.1 hypothetical protein DCS_00069 [Drechmeria coniospora]
MLPPLPLAALGAALAGLASAQVHTDCNPLNTTCPPDPGFGTEADFYFNSTPPAELWETIAGTVSYDAKKGAAFTINKQGDSPTIRTKFYFFFGRTEIFLKVAPGTGIVSSMMWLSDVLDEVDWEFLGSNKSFASTNYFGKGEQDWHNGGMHPMTGMQDDYHNYTTVWTKEKIDWYIDGALVRTLLSKDANNSRTYPQTPMRMSIGIWAGGDPSLPEGTRKWAGGDTNYADGPYTMYVTQAHVTDFSTGKEYSYGDKSGSADSIKMAPGNSTAYQFLQRPPQQSIADKWRLLPAKTKIGIYAGASFLGALIIGTLLFYIKARRGREANAAGFSDYDGHDGHRGGLSDADAYHVPATTAASPLAPSAWGAPPPVTISPSPPYRDAREPAPDAHGFDFGLNAPNSESPLLRSQSPNAPSSHPP